LQYNYLRKIWTLIEQAQKNKDKDFFLILDRYKIVGKFLRLTKKKEGDKGDNTNNNNNNNNKNKMKST